MWIDIDDLRAEIKNLEREDRKWTIDETIGAMYSGILVGYKKVEHILDEMEEIYREQGLEYIRSLREE